jgi:nucleotide-binding universal stress UspA family protein
VGGPVLIAYDGSEDAKAAVERATELFPERAAIVLTVRGAANDAETTAAEGADLARAHGRHAIAMSAKSTGDVASTILAEADRVGAAVVVVGTRGRPALTAAVLGSVSAAVTATSRRPVLVVRTEAGERRIA